MHPIVTAVRRHFRLCWLVAVFVAISSAAFAEPQAAFEEKSNVAAAEFPAELVHWSPRAGNPAATRDRCGRARLPSSRTDPRRRLPAAGVHGVDGVERDGGAGARRHSAGGDRLVSSRCARVRALVSER